MKKIILLSTFCGVTLVLANLALDTLNKRGLEDVIVTGVVLMTIHATIVPETSVSLWINR